jgi:hypothetical protein
MNSTSATLRSAVCDQVEKAATTRFALLSPTSSQRSVVCDQAVKAATTKLVPLSLAPIPRSVVYGQVEKEATTKHNLAEKLGIMMTIGLCNNRR